MIIFLEPPYPSSTNFPPIAPEVLATNEAWNLNLEFGTDGRLCQPRTSVIILYRLQQDVKDAMER